MDKIRVSAKNYDEAVTKALLELQTSSENVKVDVIEKGTGGFLGILGGKPWVIEVSLKSDKEKAELKDIPKPEKEQIKNEAARKDFLNKDAKGKTSFKKEALKREADEAIKLSEKKSSPVQHGKKQEEAHKRRTFVPVSSDNAAEKEAETNPGRSVDIDNTAQAENGFDDVYEEYDLEKKKRIKKTYTEEQARSIMYKGEAFLKELLESMEIKAESVLDFNYSDNEIFVLIKSREDLGILIGKRGKTLDSLQYLLSLVINKDTESYIRVKLDTQNYRQRRKERLESLAKNIAARVKKTRKSFSFEPMNPYERRIIHSALQNDHMISTLSEGEDPNRYITIAYKYNNPKKGRYYKNTEGYTQKNERNYRNELNNKREFRHGFKSDLDKNEV